MEFELDLQSNVTYIVDGYNVIRRIDRLHSVERQQGLQQGRNALLNSLRPAAGRRRPRMIVVFDGADVGGSAAGSHGGIEVRFSRPPQDADGEILRLLRISRDPEKVSVVTADQDLIWEVRRLGGSVLSPEELMTSRRIGAPRRKLVEPGRGEKPGPSREDAEEWLNVFGDTTLEFETPKPAAVPTPPEPNGQAQEKSKERKRARYLRRTGRRKS